MLKTLTETDLKMLMDHREQPCISLYMPTHRHWRGTDQDPIRYRNLLTEIRQALGDAYDAATTATLLQPMEDLATHHFWMHQLDGLAVFRSPGLDVHYKIPAAMPELAVVATTFHTLPLLKFLANDRRFHVLALAQNGVTLYEGDQVGLAPVEVADLPTNLQDVLGPDAENRFLTYSSQSSGGQSPLYHGLNAGDEARKVEVIKYFRAIDKALMEHLQDRRTPLILAGVEYLNAIYRTISQYPHLLAAGIAGNPEHESASKLHEKAWPLAAADLDVYTDQILAAYRQTAGTGQAIDEVAGIGRAAAEGRIQSLILADGQHLWGRYDRHSGQVALDEAPDEAAATADVLDDIAETAHSKGGEVLVVPADRMPSPSPVAAILRYPAAS